MKVNEFPDTLWLKHKNVDIGHRLRMAAPVGKLGKLFRLQKCIIVLLFVSFLCGMILGITLVTDSDFPFGSYKSDRPKEQIKQSNLIQDKLEKDIRQKQSIILENTKLQPGRVVNEKSRDNNDVHPLPGPQNPRLNLTTFDLWKKNRLKIRGNAESTKDEDVDITQGEKFPKPNYNVHAFYYPWYGNPETDGQYLHWNHQYLQHWDQNEAKKWPHGQHKPPDDIGAQFYPELGPYSSRKVEVMEEHMKQIRSAGVGVIAVSWYPPEQADEQGKPWDSFMPTLLDVANRFAVKVCFHIEPYQGRSANTMLRNFKYIHEKYGQHPAYYRYKHRNRKLPVFYVYDSYLVKKEEWGSILRPDGRKTIRNTPYDAVFLGLVVNERHKSEIIAAGFDGYYTYFASDGFTFGSGTRNWASLAQYARANEILFVPSVGPGYNDVRVRPWNAANTKDREYGGYYEQSFKAALAVRPPIISITSFNEWHEGTQIEKAAPKQYKNFKYSDYAPQPPDYYLVLTRKWALKLRRQQQQDIKHR